MYVSNEMQFYYDANYQTLNMDTCYVTIYV